MLCTNFLTSKPSYITLYKPEIIYEFKLNLLDSKYADSVVFIPSDTSPIEITISSTDFPCPSRSPAL